MINNFNNLPNSDSLNISILSRLFNDTTNSYKHLFFLAILDILEARHFNNIDSINFREIAIEMLASAWYPHIYFKLSFGIQDQISNKLDALNLDFEQFQNSNKNNLKEAINQNSLEGIINGKGILRFVPFRLIRPFFENELRGIKDYDVNPNIANLVNEYFDLKKPLYKFDNINYQDCNAIILHPEWIEYIRTNYAIIRGWASWEWLNYMQRRNPNAPAISNKLFIPEQRESLSKQRKYWKTILEHQEIECIYSHVKLNTDSKISLDHYLPWSFVAHNQLWNLIPTITAINSSKSNTIPSNQYFQEFIKVQHLGLTISFQHLTRKSWLTQIESYFADLKVNNADDLLNLEILTKAYEDTIFPLISLAQIQGFSSNWVYSSNL
jgi:hypothetical protein